MTPTHPKRIRHVKPVWPEMRVHWPHHTHAGEAHCLVKRGMHEALRITSERERVTCQRCLAKARASK